MMNLFGKKPTTPVPHPLKVHFAKTFIPTLLQTVRSGFINALASEDALGVLSRSWTKFGEANLSRKEMIEPDGLSASVFREEDHVFVAVTFPSPSCPGEPYFAIAVIGPPEGGEWTKEATEAAPCRYFVATATETGTEMEELMGEAFCNHGVGPEATLYQVIEWVMNMTGAAPVVSLQREDVEMEAAIACARETLPAIVTRFIEGELEAFTVKVRVSDGVNSEHFWLSNPHYEDAKFTGSIEAQPRLVEGISEGQLYTADWYDVTDWMHLKDGLMHGNYTLRVLLPRMPAEVAAQYESKLAPLD